LGGWQYLFSGESRSGFAALAVRTKKLTLGKGEGMRTANVYRVVRSRQAGRNVILSILTLVVSAIFGGTTGEDWAKCSVEVKVSIERTGSYGIFAGLRP